MSQMPIVDIQIAFTPAQDDLVQSSVSKSHQVSRGRLRGSNKIWIKKEMLNPAVARIELLAQEFFRLIIPNQPETRLGINLVNGTYFILSEEVPGYHNLPMGQAENFGNGTFTGLGQVVLISLFLQEIDFKNGNVGINNRNEVIKIDGDWCFAQERHPGLYGISAETIACLPYPKGVTAFNWLDLITQGVAHQSSNLVSPELVTNLQFRTELNQAMLKIALLPDDCIEHLVDACMPAGGARYATMLKTRCKTLRTSALQNKSFQAYLVSSQTETDAAELVLQMNSFVANGAGKMAPTEVQEAVREKLEALRAMLAQAVVAVNADEISAMKDTVQLFREQVTHMRADNIESAYVSSRL